MTDLNYIFKRIDKLIKNKYCWSKDCFARDKFGKQILPTHYFARSWCLLGAIEKVMNEVHNKDKELLRIETVEFLIKNIEEVDNKKFISIQIFNDSTNFNTLKRVLKRCAYESK